jgi:hypothetical protein
VNPLLIESLARQRNLTRVTSVPAPVRVRATRRRVGLVARFGEALISVGTRLAFTRLESSVVGVHDSW